MSSASNSEADEAVKEDVGKEDLFKFTFGEQQVDFAYVHPLRRIFHWGPLTALFIISTITIAGFYACLQWWPPSSSVWASINTIVYFTWLYLILWNFFQAAYIGPGFVPLGWQPPVGYTKYLQYCGQCEGYKPPRAHHCRKCSRCVMKMDHHCPWINNCCGHYNHKNFVLFLFFAPLGCLHAACILFPSIYHAIYRYHYIVYGYEDVPLIYFGVYGLLTSFLAAGLSIGVTIAVGLLFYFQMKSIWQNETGIESWIIEKAVYREKFAAEEVAAEGGGEGNDNDNPDYFNYPYDLGCTENLKQVFTCDRPRSDGFTWDVSEGCHQFTLTMEQLEQKKEKDERRVPYKIVEGFSGAVLPITKGCRVLCLPPCTDEPRIPLTPGDVVIVTRWKAHWLYGGLQVASSERPIEKGKKRVRGWFPRRCARKMIANFDDSDLHKKVD